ncbi:MAG: c-type cytochrome [Cyclobacteriaceae bacterium]
MAVTICYLGACGQEESREIQRPADPWAFRSVLDKQPRMLTLALDSACYVAYDLTRCTLYKAWKGGITMEGAAYTDKKNVQPTTWGTSYFSDSLQQFHWVAESNGKNEVLQVISRGYVLQDNQVTLKYALISSSGDTIQVEEQPEFVRSESGKPGLERSFSTSNVPEGITVSLQSPDSTIALNTDETTQLLAYYETLPAQFPPKAPEGFDHRGRYWMEKSDCFTCHELDEKTVGPSLHQIAQRYSEEEDAIEQLARKVKEGGSGVWGNTMMNPHPGLAENEVKTMVQYILSLQPEEVSESTIKSQRAVAEEVISNPKPGFGAALAGVHPSYDLTTLHSKDFQPRVGGLAFLPDGRLLVTTWDTVGGVYLLDGVETGDTSKITVKRIASGLAEPLGIEVVDGEIYVLQKQELTHLIDLDGDEVIDEYRAICNSWGVTGDFHEFSFGLLYQDGYFYATLSMAMRLMADEQQQFDRGRTIKISPDGSYEWINYGLRTPNGIGFNAEKDIFVTDNQGQWLPANKLIHVKPGEYLGMGWGLLDSMPAPSSIAQPAIWLPEDEIGNSPSEPILMQDGPYRGQLIHGDVTHGGLKRDFLEKIDGEYQGAVFRFSQGFEAGVNRLCWGPDGALYVGEVGMVGGWSWQGKQFGLQRMEYNGKPTFEMLAIRAKPQGFEIEFTEPLESEIEIHSADFLTQQWWYQPTENYGGPKMDLETLDITRMDLSEDRTRLYLEIPNLQEEHVVYFRLPEDLQSASGQSLWSSEAWYTLNHIPGKTNTAMIHTQQEH